MFYVTEKKAYMCGAVLFLSIVALYMIFGNDMSMNRPPYTMNDLAEYNEERFIAEIRAGNPKKITDIYNVSSNGIVYNFSRYTHDKKVGWIIMNSTDASVINYSELMISDVNIFKKVKKRMDE